MSAAEELKQLREEVARLRERVAVLEARPQQPVVVQPTYPPYYPVTVPVTPYYPVTVPVTPFTPFYEVTCTDGLGKVSAAPRVLAYGREN